MGLSHMILTLDSWNLLIFLNFTSETSEFAPFFLNLTLLATALCFLLWLWFFSFGKSSGFGFCFLYYIYRYRYRYMYIYTYMFFKKYYLFFIFCLEKVWDCPVLIAVVSGMYFKFYIKYMKMKIKYVRKSEHW